MDDKSHLPQLINNLEKQGYVIERNKDLTNLVSHSFIMIGHVFETGITNLIEQIFAIPGAIVKSVDARLTSIKDVSTVGFTIGTTDDSAMKKVIHTLERVCEERDLRIIKPLVIS
jgi:ACT domain-containing protein